MANVLIIDDEAGLCRLLTKLVHQEEKTSDFRVIAATNLNLETMAQQGRFRQDLLLPVTALRKCWQPRSCKLPIPMICRPIWIT